MLESVRNFLSGKRVIVIAVILAIPFVFLGSTSFGTTFSSYGTVNGEPVTQIDINLATNKVSERLQSIYGEEFSLEDLDEETSLGLIKNEIINQKTLLAQAKRMGLNTSEQKAKQEIINLDNFQGDQGFDQALFESSVRMNGFAPDEYIRLVQESMSLDTLVQAMGVSAFPIEKEIIAMASMLETSRDINFIKINKAELENTQKASLTEGQEFYDANPFLFLSQEQRDFSYIVLTFDAFKEQVNVPDGYIEEAYADYTDDIEGQMQNRISHYMIEKSNYDSDTEARQSIDKVLKDIQSGLLTFENAVTESSDDAGSKDAFGDLGLSSGDAFPEEFETAISSMVLNELSEVLELDDSFHILKLTEVLKPEVKSLAVMERQLLDELVDAEALALMQEGFLDLESMVLEGSTLGELADAANQSISITGLQNMEEITLQGFDNYSSEDLFDAAIAPNKIEIFESEDSYAFVMLTQKLESSVQPFIDVAEQAIAEVRSQKANQLIEDFSQDAEEILSGSKVLPGIAGISNETFKNVKRFSSLLPPEVITETFESSIGALVTSTAFNGDRFWAQSSNEVIPSEADFSDSIDQYRDFYTDALGKQYSGLIDKALKENQKVRLKNFTSN
ncbi:SurA N-terminal domain-containing protein [Gammaproteobacteria bacterium]|nr:SurA N-terminal domain-containing protein [Gammaproteobacteria bacterium]MDC1415292.1 SurA N-terminal domain-containing protein [Gammaproteobacteria bacterium]